MKTVVATTQLVDEYEEFIQFLRVIIENYRGIYLSLSV